LNYVDLAIIAVLAVSALLAFMRGFVREVLSIAAWVGAGFFAVWAYPYVVDRFRGWIPNKDIADPVAFASMFLVCVVFLSIISGMVGSLVRGSVLSGLDRTMGMVFGLLRGVVVICCAYIGAGLVTPPEHWPQPVQDARSLSYFYLGAVQLAALVPPEYRPKVYPPSHLEETKSGDLLHATPVGRAITRP
jgi:membrane protein required for colicin V production